MTSTTTLTDSEISNSVQDEEILDLLNQINIDYGMNYVIVPRTYIKESWFGLAETSIEYFNIYHFCGGLGPYQDICLPTDNLDDYCGYKKATVLTYLYGLVNGYRSAEMKFNACK